MSREPLLPREAVAVRVAEFSGPRNFAGTPEIVYPRILACLDPVSLAYFARTNRFHRQRVKLFLQPGLSRARISEQDREKIEQVNTIIAILRDPSARLTRIPPSLFAIVNIIDRPDEIKPFHRLARLPETNLVMLSRQGRFFKLLGDRMKKENEELAGNYKNHRESCKATFVLNLILLPLFVVSIANPMFPGSVFVFGSFFAVNALSFIAATIMQSITMKTLEKNLSDYADSIKAEEEAEYRASRDVGIGT